MPLQQTFQQRLVNVSFGGAGPFIAITTTRSGVSNGNHPPSAPFVYLTGMTFDPVAMASGDVSINSTYVQAPFPSGTEVKNPMSDKQKKLTMRWGGHPVVEVGTPPPGADHGPPASGYQDGQVIHDIEIFNLGAIKTRLNPTDKQNPVQFAVRTDELHAVDEGGGDNSGIIYFIWGHYIPDAHTATPDDAFPTFDNANQDYPFWLNTDRNHNGITSDGQEFPRIALFTVGWETAFKGLVGSPPYSPGAGGIGGTFPSRELAQSFLDYIGSIYAKFPNGFSDVLFFNSMSIYSAVVAPSGPPTVKQSTMDTTIKFEFFKKPINFTFDANNNPTWTAKADTTVTKTSSGKAPIAKKTFRVSYTLATGMTVTEIAGGPS